MAFATDMNTLVRKRLLRSVAENGNLVMLAISYIIIFGIYCFVYSEYVVKFHSYYGYLYRFSIIKILLSCSLLFFIASYFDFRVGVRDFFLNCFVIIYLAPALVLFSIGGFEFAYLFWVLGAFSLLAIASRLSFPNLVKVRLVADHRLSYLLLGVALILIGFASYLNGFRFVFNIYEVYQHRSIVNEHVSPAYAYITSMTSKVILPFSAVLAVTSRKYAAGGSAIVLSFLLFFVTGHKGVMFYTALSVVLCAYVSFFPKVYHLNMMFTLLLVVGALDAVVVSRIGADGLWGIFVNLIVRRGLFTSPFLDSLYIDYFTKHGGYWWSSSRVTLGLISPPYPVTAPFLIGTEYFNRPTMSANSGFIGAGFSQAGWLGMTIYGIILGGIISVANAMQGKVGLPVLISVLFVPFVTAMTGADLLTTFLTHGMLLSFSILLFISGQEGKT